MTLWTLIAQAPGVLPDDYRAVEDWRIWLGVLFPVALALAGAMIALIRWWPRRHIRNADADDEMDRDMRRTQDRIKLTKLEHEEGSAARLDEERRAKDDRLYAVLERELAEEKGKSERLMNELLAQRAAVELTTSPDPLEQERGRKVIAAMDVELADEPGLSTSAVRRIEEHSDAHISEASDAEDDKKGTWSWPTKKKRT